MTQSKVSRLSGVPRELGTIQDNLANKIDLITSLPILNGILIPNITLTSAAPVLVSHRLGRIPLGWFMTDNSANSIVWRSAPFNNTNIALSCSANTIVSLWVF